MLEYAKNPPYDSRLKRRNETCVSVSLQKFKSPEYNYTIFVNSGQVPQLYESYIDPYSKAPDLFTFGWLKIVGVLQSLLDSLILRGELNNTKAFVSYAYLPMHTGEHKVSFMTENWHARTIWLFPLLAASVSLGFLVWRLGVDQKVIKRSMSLNGLSSIWYHLPMLSFFSLFSLLDSLIISVLLKLFCLPHTNFLALWITVFLCLANVYPYALCIATLFNNSLALSVSSIVLNVAVSLVISKYALGSTYGMDKVAWSFFPSISSLLCIKNFLGGGSVLGDYYGYRVVYGWLLMLLDLALGFLIGLFLDHLAIMKSFGGNNIEIKADKLLPNDNEAKAYVICGNACDIYLLNKVIKRMPEFQRKRMAVLFKDGYTLDFLSVKEHFELHVGLEGGSYEDTKQRTEELAEKFNLPLSKRGKNLSSKEKKALYIVLLFSRDDDALLVLDEPTHGVNEKYHQLVYNLITQKKQQCSIFIGTRNEREAELLADFLLIHSKRTLVNEWAVPEKHYIVKTDSAEKVFACEETKEMTSFIESTKEDYAAGKVGEYSVHCKTGFCFPSASSRISSSLRQRVIAPLNHSQKFRSKIWAIFWCTWVRTVRDLKVFFFEFGAPLMAFGLLFVLSTYAPSNSYTYSLNDLPKGVGIPANYYTAKNTTTEQLFGRMKERVVMNYGKYSNESEVEDITADFSSVLYNKSKSQQSGFLGGYYITDYNDLSVQALVFGNVTSPHMPTFFANILSNQFLSSTKKNLRVHTTIIPIPFYRTSSGQITEFNLKFVFVVITGVFVAISLISMGYVVAQERVDLLKSFQTANGLKSCEYWSGKILADLSKLLILSTVLVIAHKVFRLDIPYYSAILIGSYFSCLVFFYFLNSFSHKLFTFSFLTLLSHVVIVIPAAVIITMIKLSVIMQEESSFVWIIIDGIARVIPIYNLTGTLVASVFHSLLLAEGHTFFASPLAYHFLGQWLLFSVFGLGAYFVLLLLMQDSVLARNLSTA